MRKRTLLIIAAVIVGCASGWMMIRRGFSARDNPSVLETYIAKTARRFSIPASERNATNPFSPTAEVLGEARAHFADHCAICHGNDGHGKTQIGQNLYPKAPDMRLSETQDLTDGEIYYVIHNGIRLTGMPAWGTEEKDDDSWKLVAFIRHLPQLTPAEEGEMESLNPNGFRFARHPAAIRHLSLATKTNGESQSFLEFLNDIVYSYSRYRLFVCSPSAQACRNPSRLCRVLPAKSLPASMVSPPIVPV